ncbi:MULTISPECIES: precorrin-2 C(20)-methyltransferase [Ferrimonas]|uniref:precorrin-2 C(20)-methyltransferase n=1 Tax=Ferrimonas TaxID=44011 RepID=UPI0003FF43D1|nr:MULTISPECIES: precorrin-2 C(20)-methyltransferase [Ferrimonas]USD39408.1 precorrin-2 C(20)-methyltransferase [Ferrimonas sp. SCSIO 43195]
MNKIGKIYAIGVGPGAGDLMTLRSLRLMQSLDVIAVPEKTQGQADSFAWAIARQELDLADMKGEPLYLWFPMSRDPAITVPAWEQAAESLVAQLQAGKDVGFITEGDPSVFSTWAYLQEELAERLPELEVEVVPAVSSITAVPAATTIPLADGEERFCVVPATYGIAMLPTLVEEFDTIILIKAGRMVQPLIEMLEPMGLLHCATYVSHASGANQQVYTDLRQVPDEHRYFAMVQLSIRRRKGVLRRGQS